MGDAEIAAFAQAADAVDHRITLNIIPTLDGGFARIVAAEL